MLAAAILGSGMVGASPTATSHDSLPTINELIARHRSAVGTMPPSGATWSGSISEGPTTAQYAVTVARDGRFRRTVMLPLAARADGDNGAVTWAQDENGDVQTELSTGRRSLASRLLGFNAYLLGVHPKESVDGARIIDGKSVLVVSARLGDQPATIYVDRQSALVAGADIGERTVRYREYGRFGRLMVPTTIVESHGQTTTTITVASLTWKDGAASSFDPPPARQPEFPAGKSEIVTSFDEVRGMIVLGGSVNGHPLKFLIDSGSSSSLIDLSAAQRLNLRTAGQTEVEGVAPLVGLMARADALEIAGIKHQPFVMQAVPLKLPPPIARYGIEGILGFDFLEPLVTRIAHWNQEIRFIRPAGFKYSGTGAVLPMDLSQRIPRVVAGIGQHGDKARLNVDTGSEPSLILYKEFVDAHAPDFGNLFAFGAEPARGAGGKLDVEYKTVSRLDFGVFYIDDIVASVIVRPSGSFTPTNADGIIGAGALSRFATIFLDYPAKRLILEK